MATQEEGISLLSKKTSKYDPRSNLEATGSGMGRQRGKREALPHTQPAYLLLFQI